MAASVAVAVSSDITCVAYVASQLDALFEGIGEFRIVAINDKNGTVEEYARSRSIEFSSKTCSGRVGAKQALAVCTHAAIFWSGRDLQDVVFLAYARKLRLKIFPVPVTVVANKDAGQPFDIYIGRGSPLGNPFPIEHGTEKDRANVVARYREYFYDQIVPDSEMRKYLEGLRGLKLGCHCKPLPCHGDIIAEYVNSLPFDES